MCNKCDRGIIMKQISKGDWNIEPCDCIMEEWFHIVKSKDLYQNRVRDDR